MEPDEAEASERINSEIHQLATFVRAGFADLDHEDSEVGTAFTDWKEIYGRISLDVRPGQSMLDLVGQIIGDKVHAAGLLASVLAVELSSITGETPIDVIYRVERQLTDDDAGGKT